jgi:hypothetical protein
MKLIRQVVEIRVVILFSMMFLSIPLWAQTIEHRNAKYYEVGKTADAPLFTQHILIETATSGDRRWTSQIKDETGAVVIGETAIIKNNAVVSQIVDNAQMHETSELQVGPNNVTFRTYHFVDGKRGDLIEEKIRSREENFVTGPAVELYLSKRWEQLSAGASVEVQFGILEILRSIGFELKKEGETEHLLKVKMKPSNFFIGLLVDPIHLEFDKLTKRLVRYRGRTPLRRMRDGRLKPWDAEIIYE